MPRLRAFELDVVYTKRTRLDPAREQELGITWVPTLEELLERSDVVSIHAAYNESSHGLIGARELGLMKESAFLVNTARGRIVDEAAMAEALRDRRIAGAGLDVFAGEPPWTDQVTGPHPDLMKLDNAILLPHIGGQTDTVMTDTTIDAANNLVALINGERPEGLLNPEVLAAS